MPVTAVDFEQVTKTFPGAATPALDGISFSVEEGEFVAIVGASGSGRSTLLKLVNRLHVPTGGTGRLFGEDLRTKDPVRLRHGIGYVIQQVGLFPHMTVRENIATVPRILKWDRARIAERVDSLLVLVGLDPEEYRGRYPSQLSGGQQQRVGLARALAADPRVMLLDEPFGALDAITRTKLQDELLAIFGEQGRQGKTYLFVTHDIQEAFKLGSRVLILGEGRVAQFDTPERVRNAPADDYVRALVASTRTQ
ncbi:MAG: ABC transporter ATP-binding protein [Clostridiales Family XIII bacterium]|jgi:osmoprotectant transport system ATP-binding protein|nr:ABC transporter ATP-binding protein [Clostridiales Family XIII bacterium]